MLKKVILGFLCVVILAITGGGIYLYMLDWNQHKAMVEQRFSQITGLKAVIDGRLSVELFPSPKFSANRVRFIKPAGARDPLVTVNDISAHVELWPLLHQNFILNSMTLSQMKVNVNIDKDGVLNWDGIGTTNLNKSGNIEVSFNDVHLSNCSLSYKDEKNNKEFEIPNISASISAPSLKGPYKTDGKFIHNNSEVKFRGNIVKNDSLAVNLTIENASTSSKAVIEGTLGKNASGIITFDTAHLTDFTAVVMGKEKLPEHYEGSLYTSFKYEYAPEIIKLENFTIAFNRDTKGTGAVIIKRNKNLTDINANFDMSHMNLDILENIGADFINHVQSGAKLADLNIADYSGELNIKSGDVLYHNASAKNFSLNVALQDNVLNFGRYGIDMPGETNVKGVGKVALNNFNYQFDQTVKTNDLRVFASIFNINLSKLAAAENKKSIFKKSAFTTQISGDLNKITITVPEAVVDNATVKGNIGFAKNDGKLFAVADIQGSKILFDKYVQVLPNDMKSASLESKLVHQLKLIPWDHAISVDARIALDSAVYNEKPLENILLEFSTVDETMQIKKLSIGNIAGATLQLSADASNIYTAPLFNEFNYDIKTANLPQLISALDIEASSKPLFNKKIFASQGAMSGTLNDFKISSVQKFGNTEFSYTGSVAKTEKNTIIDGTIELKTNNFTNLIRDLNLDYKPDMPVTSFTLAGNIKGTKDAFALENINAHLGANGIAGQIQLDNSEKTPKLMAKLDFDRFDADRLFNLSKKELLPVVPEAKDGFITMPQFNEGTIDYSSLKEVDFNIKATAKQLVFKNKTFTDALIDTALKDGVLKVADFKAEKDDSSVNLQFILDSNNLPKIEGTFAVKALNIPDLGGETYVLESSQLDADGSFNSLAASQKTFFENLNSRGKIQLSGTAVKGWDLDIIKFDFEQRKNVDGFEDSVLNNLRTGRSIFTRVSGKYEITKGLITAENIIWESPVANINMKFNLNLSDWLFTAVFNAVYHNASFSDVLKFTFGGNLANPTVKVDLSESIQRIRDAENMIKNAKNKEEKARLEKISKKAKELEDSLDDELKEISRMTLAFVRFKPVTSNANVNNIYNSNIETLQSTEKKLQQMLSLVRTNPTEKTLMSVEAELSAEKSKLKFIPKTLEDNFVVDSKYVFDDTFNKLVWVYNVAQNNFSYYDNLTSEYMKEVQLLDETDNPLADEQKEQLRTEVKEVSDEMDLITSLHNKIRDNYLTIIDATNVAEMEENNEIAIQALDTILTYVERLNTKIVDSIDNFRAILNISARDYDQYLLYPPKKADEIDIKKPTVPDLAKKDATPKQDDGDTSEPKADEDEKLQTSEADDIKKKDNSLAVILPKMESRQSALADILENSIKQNSEKNDVKQKKEIIKDTVLATNLSFNGLSSILPHKDVVSKEKNSDNKTLEISEPSLEELIVAEAIPVMEEKAPLSFDEELLLNTAETLPEEKTIPDTPLTTAILDIEEPAVYELVDLPAEDTEEKDNVIFREEAFVPETESHTEFKTNPVIAMEIGKNTAPVIEKDIAEQLSRKKGFKKAVTVAENQPSKQAETVDEANEELKISIPEPKPFAVQKKTLMNLLATTDMDKQFKPEIRKYVENAPVHIKNGDELTGNKYIFAVSSPRTPLKGIIGKNMLIGKEKPITDEKVEKKYIFAANSGRNLFLQGDVSKNMSLFAE